MGDITKKSNRVLRLYLSRPWVSLCKGLAPHVHCPFPCSVQATPSPRALPCILLCRTPSRSVDEAALTLSSLGLMPALSLSAAICSLFSGVGSSLPAYIPFPGENHEAWGAVAEEKATLQLCQWYPQARGFTLAAASPHARGTHDVVVWLVGLTALSLRQTPQVWVMVVVELGLPLKGPSVVSPYPPSQVLHLLESNTALIPVTNE